MEQARNSIKSMTEGSPLRLLIRFALPLMLGNILQQLYVVVDTAIVGQGLGVTALASVGAADWLNWLVSGIAQGFTQGFGVLVAIHFGAKDFGQLQKAVSGALLLSILLAIALSIASQATLLPTLTAMSTPADVLPGAVLYVRTLYCGIPFTWPSTCARPFCARWAIAKRRYGPWPSPRWSTSCWIPSLCSSFIGALPERRARPYSRKAFLPRSAYGACDAFPICGPCACNCAKNGRYSRA